jgi:hypothetical protein
LAEKEAIEYLAACGGTKGPPVASGTEIGPCTLGLFEIFEGKWEDHFITVP